MVAASRCNLWRIMLSTLLLIGLVLVPGPFSAAQGSEPLQGNVPVYQAPVGQSPAATATQPVLHNGLSERAGDNSITDESAPGAVTPTP